MSKIQKVKMHLLSGQSITARDAVAMFNYYRLADGIFKLRQAGMKIDTHKKQGIDCTYASYSLSRDIY